MLRNLEIRLEPLAVVLQARILRLFSCAIATVWGPIGDRDYGHIAHDIRLKAQMADLRDRGGLPFFK